MVHLVGLGGGGCNVLEYAMTKGFKAAYTFVTSPVRPNKTWDIEFIEWHSPDNYFQNSEWYKDEIEIPERLRIRLMKYKHSIIVSSLGGYTGTLLVKAILKHTWLEKLHFDYVLGIPFRFEGQKRNETVKYFKSTFKNIQNIKYVPFQQIAELHNNITLNQAFTIADSMVFSEISTEPMDNEKYLRIFIEQALLGFKKTNPSESKINILHKRKSHLNRHFLFNTENLSKIESVNKLLINKFKEAYLQAERIEEFLLLQMQQSGTFVCDYEIEFRLSLWAEKKYANIKELEGNPFFEYNPYVAYYKKNDERHRDVDEHKFWLFEENHNEHPEIFKNQNHCYLFHDLYDHTYLSWQDIVDIEEVWIEVIVIVQSFTKT